MTEAETVRRAAEWVTNRASTSLKVMFEKTLPNLLQDGYIEPMNASLELQGAEERFSVEPTFEDGVLTTWVVTCKGRPPVTFKRSRNVSTIAVTSPDDERIYMYYWSEENQTHLFRAIASKEMKKRGLDVIKQRLTLDLSEVVRDALEQQFFGVYG